MYNKRDTSKFVDRNKESQKKSQDPRDLQAIKDEEFESSINCKWLPQGNSFIGYLSNFKSYKVKSSDGQEISSLLMFFIDERGDSYKTYYNFEPYFYLIVKEEYLAEVQQVLAKKYEGKVVHIEIVDKIDLDMPNHLSGKMLRLLKLKFKNMNNLIGVRSNIRQIVNKNKTREKILSYSELLNPNSKDRCS